MLLKYVVKRFPTYPKAAPKNEVAPMVVEESIKEETPLQAAAPAEEKAPKAENNKRKKKAEAEMEAIEKFMAAEETLSAMAPEVKRVKQDRGLIERTESSKVVLTEDNRQVLND